MPVSFVKLTTSRPARTGEPAARAVLFPTCSVEWNRPGIGKAAVQVLERNGVEEVVLATNPNMTGEATADAARAPREISAGSCTQGEKPM